MATTANTKGFANVAEMAHELDNLGEFSKAPALRWYRMLKMLPTPASFRWRMVLLAIFCSSTPLIVLAGYLFIFSSAEPVNLWLIGSVALATLSAFFFLLIGLQACFEPMQEVRHALRGYLESGRLPNLPTSENDEPGLMMRDTQSALMKLHRSMHEIKELTLRDELTGLHNRRYLDEQLPSLIDQGARYGQTLIAVMIDIDGLKKVNDTWGHEAGDALLRFVSSLLLENTRRSDLVVRRSSDEFLLIMPQTSLVRARSVCRRIQTRCASAEWPVEVEGIPLSLSMGMASTAPGIKMVQLLEEADHQLYRAKALGKGWLFPQANELTGMPSRKSA